MDDPTDEGHPRSGAAPGHPAPGPSDERRPALDPTVGADSTITAGPPIPPPIPPVVVAAADSDDVAYEALIGQPVRGERRWPMAVAVLGLTVLPFAVPTRSASPEHILLAAIEIGLLITLIVGDPGRIDQRAGWLRTLSILLVGVLLLSAAFATLRLVHDLLTGAPAMNDPTTVLAAGAQVWIGANIAFALLYWELDGGGPAARAAGLPRYPDFAFPEQMSPHLARPGWRPEFADYLYLGLTNGLAFSPTDVMPLARWAKLSMALQSLVSIAVLSLVIARAVNIFT